jgi:hypothetical protein
LIKLVRSLRTVASKVEFTVYARVNGISKH